MQAKDQTKLMIRWWTWAGIDCADLAVRRPDGSMLWHTNLPIKELPLGWAGAENARGADVYVRPARGYVWPIMFLDDVPIEVMHRVIRKYAALAVRTSPQGGCHIWMLCRRRLDEQERAEAQRRIAPLAGADPGSVSGEHLGRLAGFKNWKRDGVWVNVARSSSGQAWDPDAIVPVRTPIRPMIPLPQPSRGLDRSESGRDWGWVCGRLEAGWEPREIYWDLVARSRPRRGADAERYAGHTLSNALQNRANG
ncbi:MAG: DNA-primase RepB domain-containing protein [Deltaproteobacteria bacterium]|nr:DNA-primase RepB domain-containing protein [Deltaproteobacteria bacterium]